MLPPGPDPGLAPGAGGEPLHLQSPDVRPVHVVPEVDPRVPPRGGGQVRGLVRVVGAARLEVHVGPAPVPLGRPRPGRGRGAAPAGPIEVAPGGGPQAAAPAAGARGEVAGLAVDCGANGGRGGGGAGRRGRRARAAGVRGGVKGLQGQRVRSTPPPVWHAVRLRFLYGALDSHPFFPSHVASGRCVLSAAAAGVPCGVVAALAEPSGWRTGGCAGGCGGRLTVVAAHSPSAFRSTTTCLAAFPCARGPIPPPPPSRVVLVVRHLPPHAAVGVGVQRA